MTTDRRKILAAANAAASGIRVSHRRSRLGLTYAPRWRKGCSRLLCSLKRRAR